LKKKGPHQRYHPVEMLNIEKDAPVKNQVVKKDIANVSQLEYPALELANAEAVKTARPP